MIKRIITTFYALILSVLITSTAVIGESAKQDYTLLILGDSISTGYGFEGYPDSKDTIDSYSNLLAQKFSKPENFVNKAIDGQKSWELSEKLKNKEYDELIGSSEIIVVTIGGNDILYLLVDTLMKAVGLDENASYSELSNIDFTDENVLRQIGLYLLSGDYKNIISERLTGFRENFIEISDYIYAKNPNAIVIYQTVYNPMSGIADLSAVDMMCQYAIAGINASYTENMWTDASQTKQKYIIADIYTDFLNKGEELTRIRSFDIHPNEAGHIRIYEICEKLLSENLTTTPTEETEVTTLSPDEDEPNPCYGDACDVPEDLIPGNATDTNMTQTDEGFFDGKGKFFIIGGASLLLVVILIALKKTALKNKR